MKKLTTCILVGTMLAATPALARTVAEIEADIKATQQEIAKDQAKLAEYQAELEKDRAEKASAKANKQYGTQAKESLEIGADKTMIKAKEAEQAVNEKILERDKEALREKEQEMAPAAGGSNQ